MAIVTTLDTFTSLIAGITMFGILGNLAHNMQIDDISKVVKGGTGLAFISYPNAISKFEYFPQVCTNYKLHYICNISVNCIDIFQGFAILFFFMLFILGLGSVAALQNVIITVLCDQFKGFKHGIVAAVTCLLAFLCGLVYLTPVFDFTAFGLTHFKLEFFLRVANG